MQLRGRERLDIVIVAIVAFVTNFLYFHFTAPDYFFPDSITYLEPARNLLHGFSYSNASGVAETLRTPGYPLLLAGFGLRVIPVVIVQHLMNVALAVGIYLFVVRRLDERSTSDGAAALRMRPRFIALTAAILFAIDTPSIHYANKILSETFFTFVLFLVFVLVAQVRGAAAGRAGLALAGLLTGALVLIRPVAIAYFAVVAFCFAVRRVRPRDVAIYVLLALVLPLGWSFRNRYASGVFTISSVRGLSLLLYRAAGVLAIEDRGDDFYDDLEEEQQKLEAAADDEIQRTLHIDDANDLPGAVRSEHFAKIAMRVVRRHPTALIKLTLRGLRVNFFDSRWEAMSVVSRLPARIVEIGIDAFTVLWFVLASIGAATRRDRDLAVLIVLTVVYFLLISAGGEAESRFRVPVIPEYAIAAACGMEWVVGRWNVASRK